MSSADAGKTDTSAPVSTRKTQPESLSRMDSAPRPPVMEDTDEEPGASGPRQDRFPLAWTATGWSGSRSSWSKSQACRSGRRHVRSVGVDGRHHDDEEVEASKGVKSRLPRPWTRRRTRTRSWRKRWLGGCCWPSSPSRQESPLRRQPRGQCRAGG